MIIIDASVAIKWIQKEKDSQKAITLFSEHLENKNKILVPQLFYYEVANTLVTKFSLPDKIIKEGLKFIFGLHLEIYHEGETEIIQAASFARKYKTTVYDMLYAVIAKKEGTILITADERFLALTKFPFVKLLSDFK